MAEQVDLSWARRIVARYESGDRVPRVSIESAMRVLNIAPGTLVRCGRAGRVFDARAAAANDLDDRE